MTLPAPVPAWMLEHCQLVGWKCALPRSHCIAVSSASAGARRWIGIPAELRIGDVRLHAARREAARKRAAAAVLDHVAELAHRGRLADDAVVDGLAALFIRSTTRAVRPPTGLPRRK
jgi:hypothetical protein